MIVWDGRTASVPVFIYKYLTKGSQIVNESGEAACYHSIIRNHF